MLGTDVGTHSESPPQEPKFSEAPQVDVHTPQASAWGTGFSQQVSLMQVVFPAQFFEQSSSLPQLSFFLPQKSPPHVVEDLQQ